MRKLIRRAVVCSLGVLVGIGASGSQGFPLPEGSETAVKVFQKALPGAKLIAVEAPKGFGVDSADGSPLFWTFRYEQNGVAGEVPITPDGLIVRLTKRISSNELPRAVATALTRESKDAKVTSYERQDIGATMKYVATPMPLVVYLVNVQNGSKTYQMAVSSSGRIGSSVDITKIGEAGEKDEGTQVAKPKEIQVAKEQQLAVSAVKKAYPGVMVVAVEEVGYEDGSGEMAVLYYEVEFPWHGRIKEGHATPDGLLLDMERVIEPGKLPLAIREAISGAMPKSVIKSAKTIEDGAAPKFVALEHPKTIYLFGVEKGGKVLTLRLASDGSVVKVFDPKTWSRH